MFHFSSSSSPYLRDQVLVKELVYKLLDFLIIILRVFGHEMFLELIDNFAGVSRSAKNVGGGISDHILLIIIIRLVRESQANKGRLGL